MLCNASTFINRKCCAYAVFLCVTCKCWKLAAFVQDQEPIKSLPEIWGTTREIGYSFRFVSFSSAFSLRVAGDVTAFIPPFFKVERGLLGPNPVTHRRALADGSGCHEGANCASGAIWGSVSCSRILRHVAQSRPGEPGI